MECIYNIDELCTNDECPMCANFCPVPETEGICQYEDRDAKFTLTPKGCFCAALLESKVELDNETISLIWDNFTEIMYRFGYLKDEDE